MQKLVKGASRFTEEDIKSFQAGTHFSIYEKLGSHLMEYEGEEGVYFAVWAPWAESVGVAGDFNYWAPEGFQLFPRWDSSGIWEGFVAGLEKGALYKYAVKTKSGQLMMKGDPYAKRWEHPPQTASMVWDFEYEWNDQAWLKKRSKDKDKIKPYSCYEVHLESWKRKSDGDPLSYRELADTLVPYVKELGFTHVELMPIMEYPYSPSWGYQITGYFAASSRFGQPEGLMYLIDQFHQAGVGVILDWVPSHFPTDAHGLAQFDGAYLYEHEDPRQGFHPDWKSAIFNYGKNEVISFLLANAMYWLKHFHVDGLRVDAVASMLYLDYSRDDGAWVANKHGGNENLEAISFLKRFNETVYLEYPDAVTIAEESTDWSGVSRPTYTGGLGFGQKWMMGWMH
ncbi:MAG: 1,4-alpha-glucan branching protein GlgB, partial [Saprospiraceae bacterium]|nr:1,4-alpha-glucan branching protein GlgB [Saprospiraceae bacterium]